MKYLIANWKSNKTLDEVRGWLENFKGFQAKEGLEIIVCPPFPYLIKVREWLDEYDIGMKPGIQDVSPFPFGTYTGAVAMGMVKDVVQYAIVGHSERRKYFHETHVEVANKVERCIEDGVTPIVCVDEPYARQQIAAISDEYLKKCIFAYEPLEHISDGVHPNPDDPKHAQKVSESIEKMLDNKAPVIYGGSANSTNIAGFMAESSIQGALVGGASLKADEWRAMIDVI